jgi:putative ABC transport system permease protein
MRRAEWAERVLRALMVAFPRDFRRRYGDEILQTYREHLASEPHNRTRWVLAAASDLVRHGLGVRWETRTRATSETNDMRASMSGFSGDVRLAFRSVRRRPGYAAVAVITLTLGLGFTTAMFSIVRAVLLRPLPFPESERLVSITTRQSSDGRRDELSLLEFVDVRSGARSLESIAAWHVEERSMSGADAAYGIRVLRASSAFFPTLGVRPEIGRTFTRAESAPVALLTHGVWERDFGADPSAVGRPIMLNGESHTIVGVLPRAFALGTTRVDVVVPLVPRPYESRSRRQRMFNVVARTANDVSPSRVAADVERLGKVFASEHAETNRGWTLEARPLAETLQASSGEARSLWTLFGAVGLLLFIACINVASLLLMRGAERQEEFSVRLALGASRARVLRQVVAETGLLCVVAGALGLAGAWWTCRVLVRAAPVVLPGWEDIVVDTRITLFAFATALAVALLASVAPAWQAARGDRSLAKATGRGSRRMHMALVTVEVALAVVLLSGTLLFVKSLRNLTAVPPGFDASNRAVATIRFAPHRYPDDARQAAYTKDLLERIRAVPGVIAVGTVTSLPLSASGVDHPIAVQFSDDARTGTAPDADFRAASPSYFAALGARIVDGREFTDRDNQSAEPVAIVNRAFLAQHGVSDRTIGRLVRIGRDTIRYRIVGIVSDIHHRKLDEAGRPEIYVPAAQWSSYDVIEVVAAASTSATTLAAAMRAAAIAIDREQPVSAVRPLAALITRSTAHERFRTTVLGSFSAIGLLLAGVGLYGLVAYTVTRRRRELGIRRALGEEPRSLMFGVLRDGMTPVVMGLAIGTITSLGLTRLVAHLLFGVTTTDVGTYVTTALVLGTAASIALAIPARRAAIADPLAALRMG